MVNKAFPDNTDTVIFASGENFPDALAASALSGTLNCPIILNPQDSLSDYAKNLLLRIRPTKVFIVGGTAAISSSMEDALNIFLGYKATRLAGDDRTQTADQIARKVLETSTADTCIICSGNDFPDALCGSCLAGNAGGAILLVDGSASSLTAEQSYILKEVGGAKNASVIGGEGAVSAEMKAAVDAAVTGS